MGEEAGWIRFAGIMMIVMGSFNAVEGVTVLFEGPHDLRFWGWAGVVIGVLAGLTGIALFADAGWVRFTAVQLAVVNSVTQLAFLPVHPLWSAIVIALCVVVIWAVIVHGAQPWKTFGTSRNTSR